MRRIGLVAAVLCLVTGLDAVFFPQHFLCVDSGPRTAQAMIVLGGGWDRPEYASLLFREKCAPRVIVSGRGDAGLNRRILLENGVPSPAIELEARSRTTRENAEFTVPLLRREGIRSAVIVTSWYHSRRALACFRHYGRGIRFYSRPSYFDFRRKDWTRSVARRIYLEFIKLPGYWLCYGVCPL
ncbi:MAG: YdcF family protein [Verrucomicrobiota bacterium]|nr:YdcF family protein [Verrucomicrobiota bacterium]